MSGAALLNASLTGRYTIERELGAGGMAVVYLAEDVRHRRKVALKVLRPELAAVIGADRFLREIETTARLQHPHILPLHDSGTVDGTAFYVMPYVEGESLRDRLRRETQLPVDDAVRIAREVASALDYAHRQGVVHRDIKPENILLHDGQALVADFGIALAVSSAGGGTRMTETGMSLGTPHYMSPEQAMGDREITARSDVYALGCVTYEMLVGEPPFTGPSAQAVIARVVTENPRSLSQQRRTIPADIDAAVQRALENLPADRFPSAAEFSTALTNASTASGYTTPAVANRGRAPARAWMMDARTLTLASLAILGVAGASLMRRGPAPATDVARLTLGAPDTGSGYFAYMNRIGPPSVSPDGRLVAYALARGAGAGLYIKFPDRFDLWAIPGGGRMPAFSPDGLWLAYARDDGIWKIRIDGGEPVRMSSSPEPASWNLQGLTWHPGGDVFVCGVSGVWVIPGAGGEPRLVRPTDSTFQEISWPSVAPDGRLVVQTRSGRTLRVAFMMPDGSRLDTLPAQLQAPAWFIADDIFVFSQAGQPTAARFDAATLGIRGSTVPLSRDIARSAPGITGAWFDASNQARLEPVWVERTGTATPLGLDAIAWRHPRLSPDGSRLAIGVAGGEVFAFNLATRARVTLSQTGSGESTWSRDGRRVLMSANPVRSRFGMVMRAADGSGTADTVLALGAQEAWPTDIVRGDSVVAFYGVNKNDRADLFFYHLRTKETRHVELAGEQRGARFSPDGRWLAYQSTEGNRSEIVVQPWPALDAKHVVSTDGGDEPAWSRDGRELFFRSGDAIMSARVNTTGAFQAQPAVTLFRGPFERDLWGDQSYDVAADGRFLMLRRALNSRVQVRVIYNWVHELRRQLDEANR